MAFLTTWPTKLLVVVLPFVLAGCGDSGPPLEKLAPVSGTVRFGGQPTKGIQVIFVPTGETKGTGAVGVTDESGAYTLMHRTQKPGIPAGDYAVHFSLFVKADGSPIPEGVSPTVAGGRQSVPRQWSDPSQAGNYNTVTVPEGGKTFDFAVPNK